MNWIKITLLGEAVARVPEIEMEFDALFMAAGCPRDMALFARQLEQDGFELYLSPQAGGYTGEVIREYDGRPCEPPALDELELIAGFRSAVQRLFARNPGQTPSGRRI